MTPDIRWQQRFQNFAKAYRFLRSALDKPSLNDLERTGVIQAYEFTFELAWNTAKDYLNERGVEAAFPRDVLKKAFQYELVTNGEVWMDMLEKRNLMAHSYDEDRSRTAHTLIRTAYEPEFRRLMETLTIKVETGE